MDDRPSLSVFYVPSDHTPLNTMLFPIRFRVVVKRWDLYLDPLPVVVCDFGVLPPRHLWIVPSPSDGGDPGE